MFQICILIPFKIFSKIFNILIYGMPYNYQEHNKIPIKNTELVTIMKKPCISPYNPLVLY